ncbi:MAG: 30S ribosomal protein S6 [Planctomycetota bacterium]|nr:30S ribosomal protein S6 [Planctomycetota bacterium]MDP6762438.1 30S ribosomal protein S6 [Planctomycetota bacterium]MDP6989136.1 30S ribosomal protein S6 [Planctomycetota bacterium]
MTKLYEGMYLVDNDVVREDWNKAKALVTGAVEKHGGKVVTARRWDERRLTYKIAGRRRATYLLAYFEIDEGALPAMTRDLELNEHVLRYLQLAVEKVPETEFELSEAETSAEFSVPEPPGDDYVEEETAPQPEEAARPPASEEAPAAAEGDPAPAPEGDGASETPEAETPQAEAAETEAAETETENTEGEPVAAQED